MKKAAPTTARVISRDHALALGPGCHPAITETLNLPAGVPTPIPSGALSYALSLAGVESLEADPSEPAITEE